MQNVQFQLLAIGNVRAPELGVLLHFENDLTILYDTSIFAFHRELLLSSPCCAAFMRPRESGLFCTDCGFDRYTGLHTGACALDEVGSLRLISVWFEHHGAVLDAETSAYDLITWVQRLRFRFATWTVEEEACSHPEEVLKSRLQELGGVEWRPSHG